METLPQLNASLERLSSMKAEDAFFHPDFVRALDLLGMPYLYDGKGTEVPQEALDLIIRISADVLCRMPPNGEIANFNKDFDRDLREYLLESLSKTRMNDANAADFARIFSKMSMFSEPRLPEAASGGNCAECDGALAYGPVSDYLGLARRLQAFEGRGFCEKMAKVACSGRGDVPANVHLFAICMRKIGSGAEIGHATFAKMRRFAKRWMNGEGVASEERHELQAGLEILEARHRELDLARRGLVAKLERDARVSARVAVISAYVAVREIQKTREMKRMNLLHPGRLRQCGGRY